MPLKLKTVEVEGKTYAEVDSKGFPVYLDTDTNKEIGFDAEFANNKVTQLQGEARGHRLAKEQAEEKLAAFAGIEDPAAAKKALQTVKNLNDKQLVDAGEVEKVKQEAIKAVEAQYKPVVEERDALKGTLHKEMIGGRFARSKFIGEKVAIPPDMVESRFGSHFAIDGGKVIAKDANGNQIYSKARPGEPADFDEALEILVDQYPYKDNILKGTGSNGGGAQGGGRPGGGTQGKQILRSEFDALPAHEKSTLMAKGEIQVIDNPAA
jgi:hypothetical protein